MARIGPLGDLVPRRRLDLLGRGATGVGELEELLAAVTLGAHDQVFVDEKLQGRVHRAGAGLPQVLGALGDLLDHFVAVHRPFDEQLEDRGAHVTALTATAATSAAAPRAAAGTETEAGSTEAGSTEAAAGTEAAEAGVAAVLTDVIAELAAGMTALFVERASVDGGETETAGGCWPEWALIR